MFIFISGGGGRERRGSGDKKKAADSNEKYVRNRKRDLDVREELPDDITTKIDALCSN